MKERFENARQYIHDLGDIFAETFHLLGLFAIGAATVWAAVLAFHDMLVIKGRPSIEDLLLLFIYLEIGSMVGIYFKTNAMPVRFLVYVGITALTRHLIGYAQHETPPGWGILILSGAILILSISVLIIRFASHHYSERLLRNGNKPPLMEG